MNQTVDVNELTAEQKARLEKLKEIFSDEQNQEKIKAMNTADDIIAFYEENGFSYGEDDKQKIREVFDELKAKASDGEISEEDLENVAGGWNLENFFAGASGGGVMGGLFAGGFAVLVGSNPIGWAIGGALAAGGAMGAALGLATD